MARGPWRAGCVKVDVRRSMVIKDQQEERDKLKLQPTRKPGGERGGEGGDTRPETPHHPPGPNR